MGHRATHRVQNARVRIAIAAVGFVAVAGTAVGAAWHARHSASGKAAHTAAGASAEAAPNARPSLGQQTTQSPSASATASASGHDPGTLPVPAGVVLQQIDGGANYFGKWPNGFPASPGFVPIGVYPSEASPAGLAAEGLNFFTPMRDEAAGTWCPVWSNPNGNDMSGVDAQAGFYAGGDFYQAAGGKAWGSRAAFDVFGDELDGNAKNWFDCVPPSITAHGQSGDWGGLAASAFEAAEAASRAADPSRPTYIQTTVTFIDGGHNYLYSLPQKQAICAGADIFSFDVYPLVLRGGHVWDMYDQIQEARKDCQDNRPVMAFTELDHMDGGSVYPRPAQTSAEVWNAIIAGARGVQYFDQYKVITDASYTGAGRYPAGAMYSAIRTTNAQVAALAPVINAPFADGYVTAKGSGNGTVSVMAKYDAGHFYVFAIPHASGSQTVTFTLAGAPDAAVSVLNENRTVNAAKGVFTDTFADEDTVHVYEIS
jgi:hypothetical protein